MEIYNSNYQKINYDATLSVIENTWSTNTSECSEETFKDEISVFQEKIGQYQPSYLIGNVTDLRYAITPQLQEWIAHNLFAKIIELGVKKYAILVSSDFLTQLSVEQTIDEEKTASFQTKYFDKRENAVNWLLK